MKPPHNVKIEIIRIKHLACLKHDKCSINVNTKLYWLSFSKLFRSVTLFAGNMNLLNAPEKDFWYTVCIKFVFICPKCVIFSLLAISDFQKEFHNPFLLLFFNFLHNPFIIFISFAKVYPSQYIPFHLYAIPVQHSEHLTIERPPHARDYQYFTHH